MIKFRVFFEHAPMEVVEAQSGEHARKLGADLAKKYNTFVKKVKRAKE